MKYVPLLLFLVCLHSSARSEGPAIKSHDVEIVIDGVLKEDIWKELNPFSTFHNCYPIDEGMASKQTEVRAFHDGKMLYIAAVYEDSLEQSNIGSLKRDDYHFGLHLSDSFGIIIDPFANQSRGYFFALNAGSSQFEGLIGNYDELNESWDTVWYGKAGNEGRKKVYEIAIPLSSLGYDPAITDWKIQFYTRDTKSRKYTAWSKFPRTRLQFDTRYLGDVRMEGLGKQQIVKTTVIPSLTYTYNDNLIEEPQHSLKPSLDVQHNLTSGLRLDATINPDFSQVDVDQQVTNLSRFDIAFPERRNFFLENSDLFADLGSYSVNPFYSRLIGADSDILFGLKLSGNLLPSTRIGLMNVQTSNEDSLAQNFGLLVAQQQLSERWFVTGFWLNRQKTDGFEMEKDYNRVLGANLNYLSANKKWFAVGNYAKALSSGLSGKNGFYNVEAAYNSPEVATYSLLSLVEENYVTDMGFTPRLYNYDPITDQVVRKGFYNMYNNLDLVHYPKSGTIDSYRYLRWETDLYLDDEGKFTELNMLVNNAVWFKNLSSVFASFFHDRVDLQYAFDPMGNGSLIEPGQYVSNALRLGYYSDNTKRFNYNASVQAGSFYDGQRQRVEAAIGYRMLPFAAIETAYEYNRLDFDELGREDFHLLQFTGEVFFSNKINWTTYVQYNTQFDNLNVNSRLQWEYRPLSYLFVVYSDNYRPDLERKDWGVSLKLNYRLQL